MKTRLMTYGASYILDELSFEIRPYGESGDYMVKVSREKELFPLTKFSEKDYDQILQWIYFTGNIRAYELALEISISFITEPLLLEEEEGNPWVFQISYRDKSKKRESMISEKLLTIPLIFGPNELIDYIYNAILSGLNHTPHLLPSDIDNKDVCKVAVDILKEQNNEYLKIYASCKDHEERVPAQVTENKKTENNMRKDDKNESCL